MTYQEVIAFWFEECTPQDWFSGDKAFDEKITSRFKDTYTQIVAGEHAVWRDTPEGSLAEVIVLDQFSRNMFRGTAQVFAADMLALALAQGAVSKGFDTQLPPEQRTFLYMPYMHSESKQVHETAVTLFEALGNKEAVEYEHIHKKIIDEFGRYPHRNKQLERVSTEIEITYLASKSEGFFNS